MHLAVLKSEYKKRAGTLLQKGNFDLAARLYRTLNRNGYLRERKLLMGELKPFLDAQALFIHVPKVAGTSIGSGLFGTVGGTHWPAWKYRIVLGDDLFLRLFKFAFVRNPWDRAYSAFNYIKKNAHQPRWEYVRGVVSQYPDFTSFVAQWLPRNQYKLEVFIPQVYYLTIQGELAVDFVGRYEQLATDFAKLAARIRIEATLPHLNASGPGADYRAAYTPGAKRVVESLYAEDIELFGYEY